MQLIDTPYKIRCEIGVCKNFAKKTIKPNRVATKAGFHICEDCMKELYGLLGKELVPSAIETLKSSKRRVKSIDE